jgi:hypothetical protein
MRREAHPFAVEAGGVGLRPHLRQRRVRVRLDGMRHSIDHLAQVQRRRQPGRHGVRAGGCDRLRLVRARLAPELLPILHGPRRPVLDLGVLGHVGSHRLRRTTVGRGRRWLQALLGRARCPHRAEVAARHRGAGLSALERLVMVQPEARAQRGQQHGNQVANGFLLHRLQAHTSWRFYWKKGRTLQGNGASNRSGGCGRRRVRRKAGLPGARSARGPAARPALALGGKQSDPMSQRLLCAQNATLFDRVLRLGQASATLLERMNYSANRSEKPRGIFHFKWNAQGDARAAGPCLFSLNWGAHASRVLWSASR